ncbi:hypothetical protein, partial [Klebsiella pneumoniae]|uniref:hypothetical protein n=1 Tax=Klebsiella pneumoniae TaxID=573 RepID=UPI003EB787BA
IASAYFVNHIAALSRQSIEREAHSYLQSEQLSMQSYFADSEQLSMQSYFAQYGKLVATFVNNPHLVNWFDNWDKRDQTLQGAPGYDEINQDFV